MNNRINWQKSVGLIAGFAGIIVANWGQEFELSFQLTGEGYMILAVLKGADCNDYGETNSFQVSM